tara:strand:+ start:66 stop:1238 length:1173 start_codon:yes stop_codon:yes gene_type:complete
MDIISFPNNYNFDNLTLGVPNGLQGGSYFTKIYNNDNKVYLQSPSCQTKQGIVKTGKKMYVDLMLTPDNQNILNWFETAVEKVQQLIYEKRNVWFHNEMDLEDIEGAFVSPVRTYKSGKFYLIRANINANNFNVYDEDENPVNIELLDDTSNKIIPLIEILGVKFTSRSFQLEISLKQTMIIQEKNLLSNCLIKRNNVLNHSNETEEIKSENKITFSNENNEMIDEIIDDENKEDENKEDENKEDEKEDDTEATENPSDINTNSLEILEESKEDETDNQEKEDITRIEEESLGEEIEENNKYDLEEVSIDFNNDDESVNLKKPNEVYLEIWREARKKAKDARKMAIQAYLEAKTIKTTYMLDEINNDSDDEFDDIIENLNVENTNQISLA